MEEEAACFLPEETFAANCVPEVVFPMAVDSAVSGRIGRIGSWKGQKEVAVCGLLSNDVAVHMATKVATECLLREGVEAGGQREVGLLGEVVVRFLEGMGRKMKAVSDRWQAGEEEGGPMAALLACLNGVPGR